VKWALSVSCGPDVEAVSMGCETAREYVHMGVRRAVCSYGQWARRCKVLGGIG